MNSNSSDKPMRMVYSNVEIYDWWKINTIVELGNNKGETRRISNYRSKQKKEEKNKRRGDLYLKYE
jgi:tRNA G37 N-methylase TrmD